MHRRLLFMHHKLNFLCIARRFNSSQKFTYRKKISYLAEFIHREKIPSLVKLAHRGKISMPHKQSCAVRKGIVHLKWNIYPSTSTDVKCRGEKLSADTVKNIVSHLNCIFKLTSFISVFVKSIRKDGFLQEKRKKSHWLIFMHCELIFMHRGLIFMRCELIFMHREKVQFLAKVYISQEDFIPCGIHA